MRVGIDIGWGRWGSFGRMWVGMDVELRFIVVLETNVIKLVILFDLCGEIEDGTVPFSRG